MKYLPLIALLLVACQASSVNASNEANSLYKTTVISEGLRNGGPLIRTIDNETHVVCYYTLQSMDCIIFTEDGRPVGG